MIRVFFGKKAIGVGMKKQKRYLFIGVIMASLFLSGCGTQLYELTKEEEDLIVHSAAYFVAKHNIQQKDGVSAVVDPDSIVLESEEEESVEGVTEQETEMAEEVISPSGGADGEETPVDDTRTTLAEAVGHSADLSIAYTGSYIADNYIEGDAYSIDAENGKTFYIMQFAVTNLTEADVLLDNVTLNPLFKLVSSEVNVKAEVTFLTTDFSTYMGTIPAGETVETILLFEISEAQAEQITAPNLQITVDNAIKSIKL